MPRRRDSAMEVCAAGLNVPATLGSFAPVQIVLKEKEPTLTPSDLLDIRMMRG